MDTLTTTASRRDGLVVPAPVAPVRRALPLLFAIMAIDGIIVGLLLPVFPDFTDSTANPALWLGVAMVLFSLTAAGNYDRHIGRYGPVLAPELIAAADVRPGEHVLDVGCGPGALTAALLARAGAGRVAAVDPSPPFAEACAARNPGAEVTVAAAEALPFPGAVFDRTLAQLVVNFMRDPAAGVAEMRRVTRPGGTVAAAVWDYAGEMTLLRRF